VEDRALHEDAAGLFGGVLIQRHDVGAGVGEKGADGRDQSRSVGAAQQKPTNVLDRHAPTTRLQVRILHLRQGVIYTSLRREICTRAESDAGESGLRPPMPVAN
jgi:hypothetical protein